MWTPRRILILFLGLGLSLAAFAGYALLLGHYDGLPVLPAKYAKRGEATVVPVYRVPPTIELLNRAFGEKSPEGNDSRRYPNRIPIPGRDGVIACGAPQPDGTAWVKVSPVSVLLYTQPKSAMADRETLEMNTFHGDEAMIQFDRPIAKVDEMSKAKVRSLELRMRPDPTEAEAEQPDPRRGRIWITSNRRSNDPADHIVFRVTGKVIVQLPEDDAPYDPQTPHIWSEPADALVEVFDRQNLPRTLRDREKAYGELNATLDSLTAVEELTHQNKPIPPLAGLMTPDDLRRPGAVADILNGLLLPPPTIVAHGLKIHLLPQKRSPSGPAKGSDGFAGIREVVLGDRVQMALWTDGDSGLPGSEPAPAKPAAKAGSPFADPPLAWAAALGGLHDAAFLAARNESRALLLITTPGQFRYEFDRGFATFATAAIPPEGQQNYVVASRLSGNGDVDNLICNKLVIEQDKTKGTGGNAAIDAGTTSIKVLTATGPQVLLSMQAEAIEASGNELKYERDDPTKTTTMTLKGLQGTPVVVKQNGQKLTAGDAANDAIARIATTDRPAGPNGQLEKESVLTVLGPGRIELLDRDPETDAPRSGVVRWGRSLKHEKVVARRRMDPAKPDERTVVHDLLKFEDNASFVDLANNFNLRADESIWLWLSNPPADPKQPPKEKSTGRLGANPERLIARGNVHLDSDDLTIRKNRALTVDFQDVPPPKPIAAAIAPVPSPAAPKPAVAEPAKLPPLTPVPEKPAVAKVPPKPKPNPMNVEADVIEATLGRYVVLEEGPPPKKPGDKPAPPQPRTKYELRSATCDDRVHVTQAPDPNDPAKPANGVDISGDKLVLTGRGPNTHAMTVTAGSAEKEWAKVTFEGTTIRGPKVEIDQANNEVAVPTRGKLSVASGSDLNGNALATPSDLDINWTKSMLFQGAKSFAQFHGDVKVRQVVKPDPPSAPASAPSKPGTEVLPPPREIGPATTTTTVSDLLCHQLDLTLDRPVYFNQLRGAERSPAAANRPVNERPKIKAVVALPVPEAGPGIKPQQLYVYLREVVLDVDGNSLRGRLLSSKQLDFANREKEQELYATGPGELRLLQPDNQDGGQPARTVSGSAPKAEKPILKLTHVTNWTKMTAKDQGNGTFQEAKFDGGARVLNAPSDDLTATLEAHALPKGSMKMECDTQLIVSSARTKKDAPADQRLTAIGNAIFVDDNRTGTGDTIVYDGLRVQLESEKRLATLLSNKKAVNQQQLAKAKRFIYNTKTGEVELTDSAGGTILPDR